MVPHRAIADNKKAGQFTTQRVEHQIQYLGLVENIKVRRAGFAYRQEFFRFTERFKLLSSKTWPRQWTVRFRKRVSM